MVHPNEETMLWFLLAGLFFLNLVFVVIAATYLVRRKE